MAKVVVLVSVVLVFVATVVMSSGGGVSALDHVDAADIITAPLIARLHLAFAGMVDDDGGAAGGGGGGWLMECWTAVTELRSCTNEIVLFFLNGESYLGNDCCVAIRTVTRHCWPSMLASVGFTAEEADVLRGFCDAEVGAHTPPLAAPVVPPAAAPAPAPTPQP